MPFSIDDKYICMCLAIPGKIISMDLDNQRAVADFNGIRRNISLSLVSNLASCGQLAIGDFVIVHAGYAIQKLEKNSALESLELIDELEEEFNRQHPVEETPTI